MSDLEIVEAYMRIPHATRMMLIRQINKDRLQFRKDKMMSYLFELESLLGCVINLNSRTIENCDAKAVLSYYLKSQGFNESEIARTFGKSSANIHHYCQQMEFELERGLKTSRTKLFKEFEKHFEK